MPCAVTDGIPTDGSHIGLLLHRGLLFLDCSGRESIGSFRRCSMPAPPLTAQRDNSSYRSATGATTLARSLVAAQLVQAIHLSILRFLATRRRRGGGDEGEAGAQKLENHAGGDCIHAGVIHDIHGETEIVSTATAISSFFSWTLARSAARVGAPGPDELLRRPQGGGYATGVGNGGGD